MLELDSFHGLNMFYRYGSQDLMILKAILLYNHYQIPDVVSGTMIDTIVGEIHTGMWATGTPELNQKITNGVDALSEFYTKESLSLHEFIWTHK